MILRTAKRRTSRSLAVNAPSRNTGWVKVLVVAIGAEGDQVVVVEGDPPGAQLGQAVHALHRVQRGPGGLAEGVPGWPADRPQAEAELVVSGRAGLLHGQAPDETHHSSEMVPARPRPVKWSLHVRS